MSQEPTPFSFGHSGGARAWCGRGFVGVDQAGFMGAHEKQERGEGQERPPEQGLAHQPAAFPPACATYEVGVSLRVIAPGEKPIALGSVFLADPVWTPDHFKVGVDKCAFGRHGANLTPFCEQIKSTPQPGTALKPPPPTQAERVSFRTDLARFGSLFTAQLERQPSAGVSDRK